MTIKYREVKRKAAVGERIKIVDKISGEQRYKNGAEFTVTEVLGVGAFIGSMLVYTSEYVVLEPLESAVPTTASTLQSDPLYAAFRQLILDNAAEIRAILPEVEAKVNSTLPPLRMIMPGDGHLVITPERGLTIVPALTRAQVIAKARADVAEIEKCANSGRLRSLGVVGMNADRRLNVEFNVNREKRAVNVIVRGHYSGRIWAKFTAKCSPADVFHAEIGKAIALRKALGLAVPTEYTDAPQPEPATDAIVRVNFDTYTLTLKDRKRERDGSQFGGFAFTTKEGGWVGDKQYTVIDDTDVDYGLAPQSAVPAKGVAA